MSQSQSSGGKAVREKRRRLSSDQPYQRPPPRVSTPVMPATRRSPARPPPDVSDPEPLPLNSLLQELALLRQSMENKFSEAEKKTDSLRNELVSKLDANDQAVSELQLAVTDVTLSVDQNQRAIHEVRAEVERREVELPAKVRAIVQEVIDGPRSRQQVNGQRHRPLRERSAVQEPLTGLGTKQEDAYDIARRSLRLWPVSREGDIHDRTVEFLVAELLVDQQYASDLRLDVRRAPGLQRGRERDQPTSAPRIKDEVIVVFSSIKERDDIRSHAKNLEKKGRGVRLEVPDHLWPSFRVLQDLAFELKQKNPKLRRNVLFDDANRDLKMDFSNDASTWKTVLPQEARNSLKRCRPARARRLSVSSDELDKLLGNRKETEAEAEDMNVSVDY